MAIDKVFQSGSLTVTLKERNVIFKSTENNLTVDYKDITSIGYGFDPNIFKSIFRQDSITVNVKGHAYVFDRCLGSSDVNKQICDAIQERVNASRFEVQNTASEQNRTSTKQKNEEEPKSNHEVIQAHINPDNVEPTVLRIELFLENKEWEKAKVYAEAGLDFFPEDYRLYKYLVFAENKVNSFDELKNHADSLNNDFNIKMLQRFGDDDTKKELEELDSNNKENHEKGRLYNKATQCMGKGEYDEAERLLRNLRGYKDSGNLLSKIEKKREAKKREIEQLNERAMRSWKYRRTIQEYHNMSDLEFNSCGFSAIEDREHICSQLSEVNQNFDDYANKERYSVMLQCYEEIQKLTKRCMRLSKSMFYSMCFRKDELKKISEKTDIQIKLIQRKMKSKKNENRETSSIETKIEGPKQKKATQSNNNVIGHKMDSQDLDYLREIGVLDD